MRHACLRLLVLVLLILALAGRPPAVLAVTPILIAPIASREASFPRTDGVTVVWQDWLPNGGGGLFAAPVSGGRPELLASSTAGPIFRFDLDAGVVVWEEGGALLARDLAGGRTIEVTRDSLRSFAITGRRVVWLTDTDEPTLRAGALDGSAASVELARPRHANEVRARGDRIAWTEIDPRPRAPDESAWRLWTLGPGDREPVLAAGGWTNPPAGFDIAGDLIVFATGAAEQSLVAVDLPTHTARELGRGAWTPTTDGRYVFAMQRMPGLDKTELRGYDLQTGADFSVARDLGWYPTAPHLKGGLLVWRHNVDERLGVYALQLADTLPTARVPATHPLFVESGAAVYFPETGHQLLFGFKAFWERSGGLAAFGYPLTEEFQLRESAAQPVRTAQLLERQRFEYFPELAGTRYEVQLGRLGAEAAALRADLRGLWAFNPVAWEAQHPPGCRYLAAIQHRLCGEFRPYWEGHGLDLGDEGVSFRESLALFGYPISEEFVDPATGLITQYFERAVFEYHPDLPSGRRVLLRRLGSEWLARQGW